MPNHKKWADMTDDERKKAGQRAKLYGWRKWCSEPIELIENYELAKKDSFAGWCLHHRLETHRYTDRGRTSWKRREEDITRSVLKAFGLYYSRPAKELIIMRNGDHARLHIVNRPPRLGKCKAPKAPKAPKATSCWHKRKNIARVKAYRSQPCLYYGREITFAGLAKRFMKLGDKHPYQTAKKYIIDPTVYEREWK